MNNAASDLTKKTPRAARAEASIWIVRLHSDARTPEMETGLREWLAAHPENAKQFEHMTEVWDVGGRVAVDGLPRMQSWTPAPRLQPFAIAALILLFFGVSWLTFDQLWRPTTYTTAHGEQRIVRLKDGSRVSLNSETHLAVEFTDQSRQVHLIKGEAYFEVARNPRASFVVVAGASRVTALGTAFVIRRELARVAVTLVEGKVAVKPGNEPERVLIPGERLTQTRSSAAQIDAPRIAAVMAWRRGEVLLDGNPLIDAIAEMNRYDDRELMIDPNLAGIYVSGVYRTGDSLGFAHAVADLHGLKVVEDAGRIYLRRNDVKIPRS